MVSRIQLWYGLIISIASNIYGVTTDKTHGGNQWGHTYTKPFKPFNSGWYFGVEVSVVKLDVYITLEENLLGFTV